jgi:hypothetical protein
LRQITKKKTLYYVKSKVDHDGMKMRSWNGIFNTGWMSDDDEIFIGTREVAVLGRHYGITIKAQTTGRCLTPINC